MPMPIYLSLYENGELRDRAERAQVLLEECALCPRECRVNRFEKEGACGVRDKALVASVGPHFGEESPLVGRCGSGTIFFAGCNLSCVFCQNYDLSHLRRGEPTSSRELADHMLYLQGIGCHNINFVTPTHVVPQILSALETAVGKGLRIPLVYNCGGYESLDTLKLLDGVFDIYMPDIKYSDNSVARRYSGIKGYWDKVQPAIKEMHRQVGDLVTKDGVAQRGLLIRHLVLPNGLSGSEKVLDFLADEISKDTYLNIMDQYRPCYKASEYDYLKRRITTSEYSEVTEMAGEKGLNRLDNRIRRLLFL